MYNKIRTISLFLVIMSSCLLIKGCDEKQSSAVDVVANMSVFPVRYQQCIDNNGASYPGEYGLDVWDYDKAEPQDKVYAEAFLFDIKLYNDRGMQIKFPGIGVVARIKQVYSNNLDIGWMDAFNSYGFLKATNGDMNCSQECMPCSLSDWSGRITFAVGLGDSDIVCKYPNTFKGKYTRKSNPIPDGPYTSTACIEFILVGKNNKPKIIKEVWVIFNKTDGLSNKFSDFNTCPRPIVAISYHRPAYSAPINPSPSPMPSPELLLKEDFDEIGKILSSPSESDLIYDPNIVADDPNYFPLPINKSCLNDISDFKLSSYNNMISDSFQIVDHSWIQLEPKKEGWSWKRMTSNLVVPILDNPEQMDYIIPKGYAVHIKFKNQVSLPEEMSVLVKNKNRSMPVPLHIKESRNGKDFILVTSFIILMDKTETQRVIKDNFGNEYYCFPTDGPATIGFPSISGDLNGDGNVDNLDMLIMCNNWLTSKMCYKDPNSLINGNTIIGIEDLGHISDNWMYETPSDPIW